MLVLEYEIEINSSANKVWDVITQAELNKIWASAFSSGSYFDGKWAEDEELVFFDPNKGGTKAILDIVAKPIHILMSHVSLLSKAGEEITTGDMAEKWIGTTEDYKIVSNKNQSILSIKIGTDMEFAQMFNDAWPKALIKIKELAESI